MKKNLFKLFLVMLFLFTVSFTIVFNNNNSISADEIENVEEVVEPSLNIYKKNVSYSSEIYIMYAVSYEGIDTSVNPIKMLFYNTVQDEYTTQTASYIVESTGSATISGVSCLVFASNGLAAKQMTDDIYARAYVEIGEETIYSDVVKYSVLEYYYEIKEAGTVSTNILNLLEAMVNYGAAAQINFEYNIDRLANATYYKVNVENAVLPDGFTSGRFQYEEQVTLTAPLKEGYVFTGWTNSSGEVVSTETTYTLTVVQDETLTANYEEEVAVTPVTLTLKKEAAYDATASTLDLPSTVTFDYNNETVTEKVIWDTTSFVVNQIGKQKLYGTLSNDSYKVNELSIEIDVLPYTFSLSNGTYILSKYYGDDETIVVPSTFQQCYIDRIGYGAFNNCSKLKSVTLSNGIVSIGLSAFENCINLMEISLPNSLYIISGYAFKNCSILNTIEIPSSVNEIGSSCFENCEELVNISLPEGLTILDKSMFKNCSKLANVILPSTLQVINDYAFKSCDNLTKITIPNNVSMISYGFYECKNLSEIIISEDSKLSDLSGAFFGCESLQELYLPKNIGIIKYYSFSNCTSLQNVYYYGSISDWCGIDFYSLYDNPMYCAKNFFIKDNGSLFYEMTEINIPESISSIGDYQFAGFKNITNICLNNSITSIGLNAFTDCNKVTNIVLPEGIMNIDDAAFTNCSSLSSIEIPNKLTSIGKRVFQNCTNMRYVVLPKGLTSIGQYSFYGCESLKVIYNLSDLELTIGSTDHGYVAYYAKYIHNELPREVSLEKEVAYDATVDTLDLPESVIFTYNEEEITQSVIWDTSTFVVNQIGKQVIYGTLSDDELYDQYNIKRGYIYIAIDVLPYTFSLIGITNEYSIKKYYGTSNEESIPERFNNTPIVNIGSHAFSECRSLTSITIPESVTSIGAYAFNHCTNLISITIPSSVTSIGAHAFDSCGSLINVYYEGTIELWCNIPFGDTSSTPMYDAAHFYMKNEEGNWYEVKEIVIPNTITEIGFVQFCGFKYITNLTISSSVTSIGEYAFYGCDSLYIIYNNSELEFELGNTTNGYVSYYAKEIINSDGTIITNDGYTYEITDDGFVFEYYNNEYTLISYIGTNDTVTLPLTINDCSYKIYRMKGVKNVVIPNGITSIDDEAFNQCYGLTSIEIPSSVTSIGEYAFHGCVAEIIWDNPTITEIGEYAFYCYLGTSITIPSSVTSIGKYAFHSSTAEIIWDNPTITEIGEYAFASYRGTNITIPSSVTSIGSSAFRSCAYLINITISSSVTSIGESAFFYCMKLASITIPNSVISIGESAFSNCTKLASITIPNSVISIGESAFFNCVKLISITIPSSVTSIGESAFQYCTNLITIYNLSDLELTIGSTDYGYVAYYAEVIYTALPDEE